MVAVVGVEGDGGAKVYEGVCDDGGVLGGGGGGYACDSVVAEEGVEGEGGGWEGWCIGEGLGLRGGRGARLLMMGNGGLSMGVE